MILWEAAHRWLGPKLKISQSTTKSQFSLAEITRSQFKSLHGINKSDISQNIDIWQSSFRVNRYEESCKGNIGTISNTYLVDNKYVVRRSKQYHSPTLGYILMERLDR